MQYAVPVVILALSFAGTLNADPFDPDWGSVGVFTAARDCAVCHQASTDQDPAISPVMRYPLEDSGTDVSPITQWTHSVMAQSFTDPYYQAKVADETAVFPHMAGFIEDKCLTCHTPMAHTHSHQTNTDLTMDPGCSLPDGCYRLDTADDQDHAREGVSCTLCHQVRADDLGSADSFSGNFSIPAAGDPDALTIYGPHENPVTGAMVNNTPYLPAYGSHTRESGLCGSCHTLYTPTLDADDGTPTGASFLEQGIYLEWQNSVYVSGSPEARECQDCHMAAPDPAGYTTRIAIRPNGSVNQSWPERSPFFTHSMTGGNAYLLALLRDNRAELGIEASTTVAGFNARIDETRDLLQRETATLSVADTRIEDDTLYADITIQNHTGHKLPGGFPSRRMWLQLTVRDNDGVVVFQSGASNAVGELATDGGRLTARCLAVDKAPDFSNSGCYEPHRDVIDDPAQVAIYEAVMGDSNGDITHVLLHGDHYLKDNRLPPRGFTTARAQVIEPQTLPAGVDGDQDFNRGNGSEGSGDDTVHYRVALASLNGPYQVEARALYQTMQPAFIQGMHASDDRVDRFKSMVAALPPAVETLAELTTTVSVPAPAPSTPPDEDPGPDTSSSGGGCAPTRGDGSATVHPLDPLLLMLLALGWHWRRTLAV